MTLGFGLLTLGTLFIITAFQNKTVADVFLGRPGDGPVDVFTTQSTDTGTGTGAALGGGGGRTSTGPSSVSGMVTIDGKPVCAWIAKDILAARKAGWTGSVTSGFRTTAEQLDVCSQCCPPGCHSFHQDKKFPGCAVDVTEALALPRYLPKGSKLQFATGDTCQCHFSYPHGGHY